MAKLAKSAKWAGPPAKKRAAIAAKKAAAPVPEVSPAAPKPAPDTVEKVIAEMTTVCDAVDEAVKGIRRTDIPWEAYSHSSTPMPWRQFEQEANKLRDRLRELVGYDKARETALVALMTPPGKEPSWARPGSFIVWFGHIPCVCDWRGFLYPSARLLPATPHSSWLFHGGATEANRVVIKPQMQTVRDFFRQLLLDETTATQWKGAKKVNTFELTGLSARGRKAAELMAAQPWVQEALKEPATPLVAIPAHVRSVQLSL